MKHINVSSLITLLFLNKSFVSFLSKIIFYTGALFTILFTFNSFSLDSINPLNPDIDEFQNPKDFSKKFTKPSIESYENVSQFKEEKMNYLLKIIEKGIQSGIKWAEHEEDLRMKNQKQ